MPTYHKNLGIYKSLLAGLMLMAVYVNARAQTLLTPNTVTAPLSAGDYYHPASITLSPGFQFTAAPGSSLRLYITSEICNPLQTAPSGAQTYVITYTPRKAGITTPSNPALATCDVMTTIQYFDGLGRPLQTVQVKGNPDGTKDVIQPVAYDQFGRGAVKYLTYTTAAGAAGSYRADALTGGQQSFYHPGGTGNSGDQLGNGLVRIPTPYASTVFEPSPLNRQVEQGAPGDPWQPGQHTVRTAYSSNNNADAAHTVKLYEATLVQTAGQEYKRVLNSTRIYNANELYLTIIKDENWQPSDGLAGQVYEYKDKEGHVVLKRIFNRKPDSSIETLSTYYVYDDIGNLSFVLPPGANADNTTPDQVTQDAFCYQYRYDGRKRLIEKKVPGKGWEFIVYNMLDQVVMTQDANQRSKSPQQMIYTKYDGSGRVVMTGVWIDDLHGGQPNINIRQDLQNIANSVGQWEQRVLNDVDGQNSGYSNNAIPQGSFGQLLTVNYYDDYTFPGNTFGGVAGDQTNNVKSLLTGTKVNVLGTNAMLLTTNYYDDEGRLIQSKAQNHLGGTDITNNTYSFTDELLTSTRAHLANGQTTTIAMVYEYDHMGRKTATKEKINTEVEVLLSKMTYNEVGQLMNKQVGNGLQSMAFAYNERGWITQSTSDKFTMQLAYNSGAAPQWNGNISSQAYNNNGTANTFSYTYDKLNRLLSGIASGMSEMLSYDSMGNIQTLQRDGTSRNYTYYNNGQSNQLRFVSGLTLTDYVYDANGNAATDGRLNKTITYNLLNLPESYSGGPNYTYLANGQKLRKVSGGVTTDYADGIQYNNGSIELIQHEEGTALRSGTTYSYRYDLKDHLGNVRTTMYRNPVNGQAEVLQQDDYYPFGLRKTGAVSGNNKYLYNGKELQEELNQYDYGARLYDPVIGRWTVIDPLAESRNWLSPYNYVQNNPIKLTDPTGALDDYDIYDDGSITVKRDDKSTNNYTYHRAGGETVDLGTYERDKETNLTNFASSLSGTSPFILDNRNGKTFANGDFAAGILGAAQDYQDQTGNTIQITQMTDSKGFHSGHGGALGQYADVRYANKDGDKVESVWTSGSNFDQKNSQILADSFRKFGFDGPASILTENAKGNGAALTGTRFPGHGKPTRPYHHKHHMHLQKYNYSNITPWIPELLRKRDQYSAPFSWEMGGL